MKFEIGKSYEHPSGEQIYIVGEANTILYGHCLIGEVGHSTQHKIQLEIDSNCNSPAIAVLQPSCDRNSDYFRPVGECNDSAQNYYEISLELFKLSNFVLRKKEKLYCERRLKLERILK